MRDVAEREELTFEERGRLLNQMPYFPGATADRVVAEVEHIIASRLAPVWAILNAWEAWDGSPGPDGRMHPDSSSPHDRDRLRAALLARPTQPGEAS